ADSTSRDKGPRGGWNLLVGWCPKPLGRAPMKLPRRKFLHLAAGAAALSVMPRFARAQAYPTRPVRPRTVSGAVLANNNEIVALSARAAADYIRRGELSAERYAQALLERYKAHTDLNAVAHIDEVKLLEDAREVDRARMRGAQLGPLA